MKRYDLDFEWSVIEPLLPNKPRGVPRVDRRVTASCGCCAAPLARLAGAHGPYTTWTASIAGQERGGDRLMDAIVEAYDGDIQMIDSSSVRVHQQQRAQKGGSGSLHGSFPRRNDEDPHRGRCHWPAASLRPEPRAGP